MTNTEIEYLYRDNSNNKTYNKAVVAGTLTPDEIQEIKTCLHDGCQFIPEQVGLYEDRGWDWDDQEDGPWFELYPESQITTTNHKPYGCDVKDTKDLLKKFRTAKNNWHETDL